MSSILLIHRLNAVGQVIETNYYRKIDPTRLEDITDIKKLISASKPTVYMTGLGALSQEKRLKTILQKLGNYAVERVPFEGNKGLTAFSQISHGKVPPKYS